MIQIKKFVFNALQENTYILYDETKTCVIVDAGCSTQAEEQKLSAFIADNQLKPFALINTHCHFDHVLGSAFVCNTYQVPFWIDQKEMANINRFEAYASLFGVTANTPAVPTHFFENNQFLFGNSTLQIIYTPGHSAGGVCFYAKAEQFIIVGDTLFAGSVGRTDLPEGSLDQLMVSIKKGLFVLPSDTSVYCGHGPETTIGVEIQSNPFML